MFSVLKRLNTLIDSFGEFLQSILLLAIRLFWGGSFMLAGWGKFFNIPKVSEYFASLNIPFPIQQAYLVATVECVGGLFLLIGLASRWVSIPLSCVMIVAYITAHNEALVNIWNDPDTFIKESPFNFLLATLLVLAFGPGKISVDYLLRKKK
jgi:putative oxidoreductase